MLKPLFHRAYLPAPRSFLISRTPPARAIAQGGPHVTRPPLFATRRPAAGVYERAPVPGSGASAARKKFQGTDRGTGVCQ